MSRSFRGQARSGWTDPTGVSQGRPIPDLREFLSARAQSGLVVQHGSVGDVT